MVSALPAARDPGRPGRPESEDRRPRVPRLGAEGSRAPAMRILLFNPSYPPVACGVGAYTRGLAEALVGAGHDVTVITCAGSTTTTDGPPRVLALLQGWGVGAFLRARRRFSRPRPDLVVSSY